MAVENARKTKEDRGRDEEKEAAFRDQVRCKSDEDFWDEYDRLRAQLLDPIEQKVLLEERTRRKAKQVQKSSQESWRDKPAMDDEEQKTQEENLKQRDINDWQAQRLLSRSMLRQIMQEMVDEEMRDPDRTALSGHQDGDWQFQLHNASRPGL